MKKIIGIISILSIVFCIQVSAYDQNEIKDRLKNLKPKDYPTEPIEFVVVYPAGGGMDITARILAKHVEKLIDHRVIVLNKAGGAGLVGYTYLCTQAKNDGYTVGIISSLFLNDELLRAGGKFAYTDLEPLSFINSDPYQWIVNANGQLKDKSLVDAIDIAKKNPETLKVSMVPETSSQFLIEQVEEISGAKFIKIPFQGGKAGIVSMLGGHVDIAYGQYSEFKSHLEAGQVKILALTGTDRYSPLSNIPTFNELLGSKDFLWEAWRFAATPKGIPKDRFRYLEAAIDAALHDPECIKDYETSGNIVGVKYMNAKQTTEDLNKQYKIIKDFFIKTGRLSK